MRVLIGAAGLLLAAGFAISHAPTAAPVAPDAAASPSGAFGTDDVFTEVNPYHCVRGVKGASGAAAARRAALAECLRRVPDPVQALRALEAEGFNVPYGTRQEIESSVNRGHRTEAQELVAKLVNSGTPK